MSYEGDFKHYSSVIEGSYNPFGPLPTEEKPVPIGTKQDTGKDRWELTPFDAVREVVKILTFGATKYEVRNWEKGISFGRLYAATLRHLTSWWDGEDTDPESGRSHLSHAATNVLFILAFVLRGRKDLDDRPKRS